jgi:hypothetical protein
MSELCGCKHSLGLHDRHGCHGSAGNCDCNFAVYRGDEMIKHESFIKRKQKFIKGDNVIVHESRRGEYLAKVMGLSQDSPHERVKIYRVHDLAGTIAYVYEHQMEMYDE